ncbi:MULTISPECIES: outer membrane-stress sensor serine endopeptidase DegS [Aliagarivorans]|uniref:outer membrane-stress sensor serine endopeptidase DegS n=1 Tax=Aliagarivorans TaxID=882379 RepID=UPI000423927A|nr:MULTISPECIES: outer membrane-stress sensor serine endopeptidase DegS [Aliagarivorans]
MSVIKYLLKPALFGLAIAIGILFAFPEFRESGKQLIDDYTEVPLASYSSAARKAAPAVVNIYTRSFLQSYVTAEQQIENQGLGSGVLMSTQGYILTNLHVIANSDQIIVALQDGRIFNAELVGGDRITDLAVLKIDASPDLPVIPQNDQLNPQVGDVVLAIGNPYNIGQTITQGIISATGRNGMSSTGRQDFLQTDAAINRGNSGGALINTRGEILGINTSAFHISEQNDTYGINFAIPFKLAKRIMNSLISDGKVVRGYLGLDGQRITPMVASRLNISNVKGVLVTGVDPNGPAAIAGMMANDILLSINGNEVESVRDAMDIVAETRPGSEIQVRLYRNGQLLELPVTVSELVF